MKAAQKIATLTFILVFASSATLLPALSTAQVTRPQVPQFNVVLSNDSRYVSRTATADLYTGETINQGGYSIDNITVLVKIQNQPFTPTVLPDGNTTFLCYAVAF